MAAFAKRPSQTEAPASAHGSASAGPQVVSYAAQGPTRIDDDAGAGNPLPAVLRLAAAATLVVGILLVALLVLSPPAAVDEEDTRLDRVPSRIA